MKIPFFGWKSQNKESHFQSWQQSCPVPRAQTAALWEGAGMRDPHLSAHWLSGSASLGKVRHLLCKIPPQMSLLLLLSSAFAVFTHSCTSTLLNCDVFFPCDLFVCAAVVFRGSCYNCICNHTDRFRGIRWINMVLLNTHVQILVFAHWSKDWLCHSNFRACLPVLSLGIAWFPFICSALSFCICCSWSQAARLCIKYVACRNNKCQQNYLHYQPSGALYELSCSS